MKSSLSTECLSKPIQFVFYFIPFSFIFVINSYIYRTKWISGNSNPIYIVFMWSEPITLHMVGVVLASTNLHCGSNPSLSLFLFPSFPPFLSVTTLSVGESIPDSEPVQPSATCGTENGPCTTTHNTKSQTASDNSGSTVETLSVIKLQYINRYDANVYRRKAPGCRALAIYLWTKKQDA
jgi:hypothetical protein